MKETYRVSHLTVGDLDQPTSTTLSRYNTLTIVKHQSLQVLPMSGDNVPGVRCPPAPNFDRKFITLRLHSTEPVTERYEGIPLL